MSGFSEASLTQPSDDRASLGSPVAADGETGLGNPGPRGETGTVRRVLREHEFDRRLLALDLHDGLMQYVIGALMHLDALHDRHAPLAPDAQNQLDRARSLMRQAVVEGRRLIAGVRPPIIDEKGLTEALKDLVARNQRSSPIAIELEVATGGRRYSPLIEGMVYRIVQEALTNIQRHSQSPRALVRLIDDEDEGLRLEVRDWGVGFKVGQTGSNSHGLDGIHERTKWLGGRCEVISAPGEGTSIIVRLPLSPSSLDVLKTCRA